VPVAGYVASVKASGTAVVMTGEATTSLGSQRYQVTNTIKRILDPGTALVVKDGGSPIAATGYTVNYLFGIVTLVSPPGGAVTIDGAYLPTYTVGEVRGFSFTGSADLADVSTMGTQAIAKFTTLVDCSGNFNTLRIFNEDIDTGLGGTQNVFTWLKSGTPKLLEVDFGSGTERYLRAWFLFADLEVAAAHDGVVEGTANFQGAQQAGTAQFGTGT
jgi:hypothetical protein